MQLELQDDAANFSHMVYPAPPHLPAQPIVGPRPAPPDWKLARQIAIKALGVAKDENSSALRAQALLDVAYVQVPGDRYIYVCQGGRTAIGPNFVGFVPHPGTTLK